MKRRLCASALAVAVAGGLGFNSAPQMACDGIADNTAALQFLIDHYPYNWSEIVLPAGTCNVSGTIYLPDKPVSIRGQGVDQTVLRWTQPVVGIQGVFSSPFGRSVVIKDLSLIQTVQGGIALNLGWPPNVWSGYLPTVTIQNVLIAGELGQPAGWEHGIRLVDAWNAVIQDVTVNGGFPQSYNDFVMLTGVSLERRTIAARITALKVNWAHKGILAIGDVEGLKIAQTELVGVRHGIYATADHQVPVIQITDTHIAAITAGVVLENRVQNSLMGNALYRWSGPADGAYYGIVLAPGTSQTRVIGNYFLGKANAAGTAVVAMKNTSGTILDSNQIQLLTQPVWTQAGAIGVVSR